MLAFLTPLLFSIVIFVGAGIVGVDWLIKKNIDPILQKDIEVETKSLDDYLDDLEFLRGQAIFETSFNGRKNTGEDAGPEFNHSLHWVPDQNGFVQKALVPAEIQDRILRIGRNWSLHTGHFRRDFKTKSVDLKIFSGISKFDYWNIEKDSPIEELIKQNKYVASEKIPSLDSLDLIALSKLRLLEAVFEKDYLQALKDVRRLVELLLTTENFRLELTALSILEAEHTAHVLYLENKWITADDWAEVDSNATRRASRAIWATRGYLRFWTPEAILKKIYLSEKTPIGFCAAVNDSLPGELAMKAYMGTSLPFERDYDANYQVIEQIYQRALNLCHLSYLGQIRIQDNYGEGRLQRFMSRLPYVRKLFGLIVSSSHFDGFGDYRDAGSAPAN